MHHVVQQLPPLHYKTVEFLLKHLAKLASYEKETGMHAKNLSIVWAPNLMRKEKIEDSSCTLQHLGSQAVVVEYLIRNVNIFFDKDTAARAITRYPLSPKTLTRERSRSDPSCEYCNILMYCNILCKKGQEVLQCWNVCFSKSITGL